MKRVFLAPLLALALPAAAQDQGVQRELMQRRQQSDAFSLQLRQSQERRPADPGQLAERQRLDSLNAQQLRDARPDLAPELRPYERQKADDERRRFTGPILEVPTRPSPPPARLEPSLQGNVPPIVAPRDQER